MKNTIKILAVASITLFIACGSNKENSSKDDLASLKKQQKEIQDKITALEAADTSKKTMRKMPVIVSDIMPSTFISYIDVQGKVDLDDVVNAIPEAPGIIQSILVKPGQYVHKGQVVATLRSETIQRGIAQLDQQIDFAKTVYEKQKRLWDQEVGTEIQLLSAKNNYESLLKQKETTLSNKSSFNVYSPISGVVDAVDATVGQSFASPVNPPIIRIINTSKLKVVADIPENYASIVHSGNQAMLIFPDMNDTFITKVNYVEKMINPVSRTYAAYIPIQGSKYQPNMTVRVKVVSYRNDKAYVLPYTIIQKSDKGEFVFVADENNKAKMRMIKVGNTYNSKAEIIEGLLPNDKVITVGYEELNEGDDLELNKEI